MAGNFHSLLYNFQDGDVFIDVHANTLEEVIEHILDRIRHKEKDIRPYEAKGNILTYPLDVFANSLQVTCFFLRFVEVHNDRI